MPDIVAHVSMGNKVLAMLDTEIAACIDPSVFRFGILGPDPYIYYRFFAPFFRCGVNKRGAIMHREKTGVFLTELAKVSGENGMFSFLAGFLCHFALDANAHPYINAKAKGNSNLHTAIEHKLDMLELQRQGTDVRAIDRLFEPYQKLPAVGQVLKHVYGWQMDYSRSSYKHMRLFHYIVKDRWGILNGMFGHMHSRLAALSYKTKLCEGLDLKEYQEFEARAVQEACELVSEAYRIMKGEASVQRFGMLVGSRCYDGD